MHIQANLLFFKGYPTNEWLSTIGAMGSIDPGLIQNYMDFRFKNDLFSLSSFEPSQTFTIKLHVTTIGIHRGQGPGLEHLSLRELSATCTENLKRYTENLVNGDSIFRKFSLIDNTYFVVEQEISISVFQLSGASWTAFVCSDIGRRLGDDTKAPWYLLDDFKFYLNPKAPAQISTGDDFSNNGTYLAQDYGKSLNLELMRLSPFYALSELFRFTANAELQFVNVLESRIALLVKWPEDSSLEDVQGLKNVSELLHRHEVQIKDMVEVLHNRGSPFWPKTSLENRKMKELVESTAVSLLNDFNHLHQRILSSMKLCDHQIHVHMSLSYISESRNAIEQSKQVARLTWLTLFFVPLSFTSSIFGMNLTKLPAQTIQYWLGTLTLLFAFLFVLIVGFPGDMGLPRRVATYIKSFLNPAWFFNESWLANATETEFERIIWMCECGTKLFSDVPTGNHQIIEDLRKCVSPFRPTGTHQHGEENNSLQLPSVPSVSHSRRINSGPVDAGPSCARPSPSQYALPLNTAGQNQGAEKLTPRFLELCVNVGFMKSRIAEIDVTHIASDGELFAEIRKRYWGLRKLSFRHKLTRPVTLKFIKFQLEDQHRVWVLGEEPPPLTEIYSERYSFQRPQMPTEAFFHYFHKSTFTTHATRRWISHLPQKLDGSIFLPNKQLDGVISAMPTAWGIIIEEKLDHVKVLGIVVLPLLLMTILITVVWSICSGSRTEGLTAGALVATILAVGVVSIYKAFEQGFP